MGLFDWLGQHINHDAEQRARVVVADEQNLTTAKKGTVAVAEQHYIRMWLSEMFLHSGERWFSDRFPLTYSLVGVEYAGQKVELANVSGKNKFEIKQPDLDKSILRNYALTPLLPFHGGTIEVDCGLVSMSAGNLIQSFAGVLSDVAGKLNAPQVAAVVGIAEAVASGVQDLLGAGTPKPCSTCMIPSPQAPCETSISSSHLSVRSTFRPTRSGSRMTGCAPAPPPLV
jgi:hypothetical protein